jgi:hypothetical protein
MYENIVVTYIITFIQVSSSICLIESKTDDTDEILLPGYISKSLIGITLQLYAFKHLVHIVFKIPHNRLLLI